MLLNFASSSSAKLSTASAASALQKRVHAWVQDDERYNRIVAADPSVQLMVSEVACFDEGCVPLETIVIVVGAQSRWMGKLLRPLAEVTAEHVGAELELPQRWWLYSRLQALRSRPGEATGAAGVCTQSEVEAAYRWIEKHCADNGPGGLLSALGAAASVAASVAAPAAAAAKAVVEDKQGASGDGMTVSRALLLLSLATEGIDLCGGEGGGGAVLGRGGGDAAAQDEASSVAAVAAPAAQVGTSTGVALATATPASERAESGLLHLPPPADGPTYFTKAYSAAPASALSSAGPPPRHDKSRGVRQRGCPCCDPDSIDGYVDKMFMSNI